MHSLWSFLGYTKLLYQSVEINENAILSLQHGEKAQNLALDTMLKGFHIDLNKREVAIYKQVREIEVINCNNFFLQPCT